FAPDAIIALDGKPVATGQWTGAVAPGAHLVQVYKPGGPSYDFPIDAKPGQTVALPPPTSAPVPTPEPPRPAKRHRFVEGLYLVGQLGFSGLTAKPDGFSYDLYYDEDTGTNREHVGFAWFVGGVAGYRLSRGFGVGGLLLYGRGGGGGTMHQIEPSSLGGVLTHDGPADFLLQYVRLGPHFRFMAGGDRARFLAGTSLGAVYQFIDLEQVDLVEQGGALIERGTEHHDDDGFGQFWGFDLGAEFNTGDHLILGFAFDFFLDRTNGISGDPYGGTAQGLVGLSARIGFHDWKNDD
ncbi:MAG TPA: hypothetical protein VGP93_18425, partial [Polyangiaceae bacterium]|nr:hypothetical protein [Polyangiaceae bacterium]